MCDVAYALLADRVYTAAVADRAAMIVAKALGAEVDVPDPDAALADFDAALRAEPKVVDPEQDVMLRGLGLRR